MRCLECKHWRPTTELLGVCEKKGLTTLANKRCGWFEPLRVSKSFVYLPVACKTPFCKGGVVHVRSSIEGN